MLTWYQVIFFFATFIPFVVIGVVTNKPKKKKGFRSLFANRNFNFLLIPIVAIVGTIASVLFDATYPAWAWGIYTGYLVGTYGHNLFEDLKKQGKVSSVLAVTAVIAFILVLFMVATGNFGAQSLVGGTPAEEVDYGPTVDFMLGDPAIDYSRVVGVKLGFDACVPADCQDNEATFYVDNVARRTFSFPPCGSSFQQSFVEVVPFDGSVLAGAEEVSLRGACIESSLNSLEVVQRVECTQDADCLVNNLGEKVGNLQMTLNGACVNYQCDYNQVVRVVNPDKPVDLDTRTLLEKFVDLIASLFRGGA